MARDAGVVYLLIVIAHLCSCARYVNYNECKYEGQFGQRGREIPPFLSPGVV